MEDFTLNTFLMWVVSGGATIVARYVIARIPALQKELEESERGAVTALASVILITAAFVGATRLGYIPMPQTGQEWFESLFPPVATALGLPAIMTATMQVKGAQADREPGVRSLLSRERNTLFGFRW